MENKKNNLPESVVNFLNYLETIKNKSINTIDGYKVDLTTFFRFMMIHKKKVRKNIDFEKIDISGIDGVFLESITLDDIYSFLSFCQLERGNGAYARARKVYCLKSYFNYLQGKAKMITYNPCYELESPQINSVQPVYLTVSQSKKLLESLDEKSRNYQRDYCMITLLLNTGMRLNELCNIRLSKIQEDSIKILGKGQKERTAYLNENSLRTIRQYLAVRKDDKAKESDKDYLFLSERQKHISKRTIEALMKKHYANANLNDKKYVVHSTRHAFATRMYGKGVDIYALQKLLGHSNISTTTRYMHLDDSVLRKIVSDNGI